jgi:hypothetical protein
MKRKQKVKLLNVASEKSVNGVIRSGTLKEMPSMKTGWEFDFDKNFKLPLSQSYVLTTVKTPDIIEGALNFQLLNNEIPYLAYVEIAPQNRTKPKEYKNVAECLIAYACKLSFQQGKAPYHKGFLILDVLEDNLENEQKLINHYRTKYNALLFIPPTKLLIPPKVGKVHIEKYLEG